jgi:hypothetical protein
MPGSGGGAFQGDARQEPHSSFFFFYVPAQISVPPLPRALVTREWPRFQNPWQDAVETPARSWGSCVAARSACPGLVRLTHCHVWPASLMRPRALNLHHLQDTHSEPTVCEIILQQSSTTLLHSLASATTERETCLSRHQRYYAQVATISA